MKESMSALDIKVCLKELDVLTQAWVGKIYEIDSKFLLRFNSPEEGKKELIIEPGKRIHLTKKKHKTPERPPSFAMLLRKHLSNKRLTEISQPDLERVVVLKFEGKHEIRFLIAELFGEGNLLLCNEEKEIIKPYHARSWEDRSLESGENYALPPKKGRDISSVGLEEVKNILSDSPDLVRGLARNLNIGGNIAEEICARAGIDKTIDPKSLSETQFTHIISAIESLLDEETSPQIIYEDGKPVEFIPFPFKTLKDSKSESFETFNQTIDEYFQTISKRKFETKKENKFEEKVSRIKERLEKQKERLEKLKEEARETRKSADAISTYHSRIDSTLEKLNKVRESEGWEKIEGKIEKPKTERESWAKAIVSMDPQSGIVNLEVPKGVVNLDIRLNSFENASELYEKNKKLKNKIEGTKSAIEDTKEELGRIREKEIEISKKEVPKTRRKQKWYEKYRWFWTSDNLIVVAGRDRKTNQEVVEKHMEKQDLYLHADLEGAPHVVIKNDDGEIPQSSVEEASKFAGMHSKAWERGLNNIDVYWVKPDQVSKEAPAGEYLPKGGYMVEGDRNYLTVSLKAAVGFLNREDDIIPMCGPPTAIETHSDIIVTITPGGMKKSKLAKKIKEIFEENSDQEVNLDELMQILPPGAGTITSK